MYGSMSLGLCLAFLFALPGIGGQQLGTDVDDKVKDELFRKMGQIYVEQFNIDAQLLTLEVVAEDTVGTSELFVIDFQPYNFDAPNYPVDPDTGDIIASNTGECSNLIDYGTFSAFGPGYFFTDDGNFQDRTVSLKTALSDGNKRLFSEYTKGAPYTTNDQYGDSLSRSDYLMTYTGHIGYMFNCTNTHGTNIWTFMNTTDTIEYHTTMYVTNVRPIDNTDGTKGMAYVTTEVTLIYRLSRIAIANFVISSSPLVKPVLDYAIVSPYFDVNGDPVATKAKIEIQFKTIVPSQTVDGYTLQFKPDSEEYTPENNLNFMSSDGGDEISYDSVESPCIFGSSQECTQTWNFELVLYVNDDVDESELPIDATGVFKFEFHQYECTDPTADPPTGCVQTAASAFAITLDITIQTIVYVRDAAKDYPSLYLLSITGSNNNDLRGGVRAGSRGVNHLESVNMKIQMLPEFLRDVFTLQLTMFMVCKDDRTDDLGGCLDVDVANRYIAYQTGDFRFVGVDEQGADKVYTIADVSEDNWSQDPSNQVLDVFGYDLTNEYYDIDWTNNALSQERLEYTITTVFTLVEKTGTERKKRAAVEMDSDLIKRELVVVNSAGHHGLLPASALVRDVEERRHRRDAIDHADEPTGHHTTIQFAGCPERSLFEEESRSCDCEHRDEIYSNKTYECEKALLLLDFDPKVLSPLDSHAEKPKSTLFMLLFIFIVSLLSYLS